MLTVQTTSQLILTKKKSVYLAPTKTNEPNFQMTYLTRLKALIEYGLCGCQAW